MMSLAFISMSFTNTNTDEISTLSGFCDGWDDGYQDALDECMKVAMTPMCPMEPIGSKGYKTGYGRGYAAANARHC